MSFELFRMDADSVESKAFFALQRRKRLAALLRESSQDAARLQPPMPASVHGNQSSPAQTRLAATNDRLTPVASWERQAPERLNHPAHFHLRPQDQQLHLNQGWETTKICYYCAEDLFSAQIVLNACYIL